MPDLGIKGIVASPAMRASQTKTYSIKGVIFPPPGGTLPEIAAICGNPYTRKGIATAYTALVPLEAEAEDADNPF